MKSEKSDYLKYWRVVRYYVKARYELSECELEMILFLYTEDYFSKDKFAEFNDLMSWNKDRFESLRQRGWICVFRKRMGKRKALYELSYKAKRMVTNIYKKLLGEEIVVTRTNNPLFKKNISSTDKIYAEMIKTMNKSIKEKRVKYGNDLL